MVTTELKYITGNFKALYSAKAKGGLNNIADIQLSDKFISDVRAIAPYEPKYHTLGQYWQHYIVLKDVRIELTDALTGSKSYFVEDLHNVVVKNITLQAFKDGEENLGYMFGTLLGTLKKEIPDPTPVTDNSKKVTETIKSGSVKREPGGTDTAAQSGCALWLWLLGALLLLLGLFTFPAIFKFLLLVLLLMVIFSLIGGALEGKGLGCGGLLLLLILLYLLSNLWKGRSEGGGGGRRTDDRDRSSEIVLDTSSVKRMEGDTLSMKSCLNWLDFTPQSYGACFSVSQKQYFAAKYTRENYNNNIRNVDDWRRLYTLLTKTDINNLPGIYEKYDSIRRTNQLSEYKFAEMVVTSVQEIPYSYVMPEECTGGEGKPCIGNIKFGVQSPSEFFYTMQGDCDTRAVFLFTVLTHYGYDVAVIISPAYEHAMLAVNLPYTGSYLRYGGKKYFVWETTAKYQHLGEINPQWGNMDNWEICLVSKQ